MGAMMSSVLGVDWLTTARGGAPALARHAALWRTGVIAACALAIGLAASMGHPSTYMQADPALAHLLRAMALIKGLIVVGALAAALWRYGWPITAPVGLGYAAGVAMLAGSTTMVWELTLIPLAALMFHGALVGIACLGWRDR
jgi:hypothetical protein